MPLSNEHATCSMSTYFQRFIVFCVQPSRSRWQLVFFITALLFGSGTMTYVLLGTSREQQWTSEPSDGDVNAPSVSAHTNENAPLVSDSVSNSCTYGAVSDVVSWWQWHQTWKGVKTFDPAQPDQVFECFETKKIPGQPLDSSIRKPNRNRGY